jgi:hypothetical protein
MRGGITLCFPTLQHNAIDSIIYSVDMDVTCVTKTYQSKIKLTKNENACPIQTVLHRKAENVPAYSIELQLSNSKKGHSPVTR